MRVRPYQVRVERLEHDQQKYIEPLISMLHDLTSLKDSEIRSACKERIETLEHWLRRLIDDLLSKVSDDYFNHSDARGNRLIKKELVQRIDKRQSAEPERYRRKIDAILLGDAIDIICKPQLFDQHFRKPFEGAFPQGCEVARTYMERLLDPRNKLSHANSISLRQAEQVICYSNDIVDTLKKYYREQGMQQEYDVPLIFKMTDSFGNTLNRSQFSQLGTGSVSFDFRSNNMFTLRAGDQLSIEIEVDSSYEKDDYQLTWQLFKPRLRTITNEPRLIIKITEQHVSELFMVTVNVTSRKNQWHRLLNGADDELALMYKVLPPLS